MRAYLTGTLRQPAVALYFPRDAVHPTLRTPVEGGTVPMTLMEWVKKAPGRTWDPDLRCWTLTAFGSGKDPDRMITNAGFTIDYVNGPPGRLLDGSLLGILSLSDLIPPMAQASVAKPSTVLVRPRFLGWEGTRELLGMGCKWDKPTGRFEAPLTDILQSGDPKRGLIVDEATVAKARDMLINGYQMRLVHDEHSPEAIASAAATAALSSGEGETHDVEGLQRLIDVVGDFPDWFGMDPRPYQRVGALSAVAGHNFFADDMGLGKTVQVIGAFAIRECERIVVIVPPVVVTHWAREIEKCGLAVVPPKPVKKKAARKPRKKTVDRKGLTVVPGEVVGGATAPAEVSAAPHPNQPGDVQHPVAPPTVDTALIESSDVPSVSGDTAVVGTRADGSIPGHIVMFRAGRKEPELPERGVVIVPDSLLAHRPALLAQLIAWQPDGVAYDEAHRGRTWDSKRGEASRALAEGAAPGALRIPSTGTPMFSSPQDLASMLAFSGHLGPIFGGYDAFISRYCKRNHFKALVPRLEMLDELREKLNEHVWVRRMKKDVLKDLPPKSRSALFVDVDLKGFRAAHEEVIDKVMIWLDGFHDQLGRLPTEEEASAWAKTQIGLMSPLRKAAGLAKVPVAMDLAADWVEEHVQVNADGSTYCERPLLLWAHHQEVVAALKESISSHRKLKRGSMVGVIDGSTNADERGRLVDEFQAGRIPVLVCSITAAGVGITLTRSSDATFVEADWSVPVMSQAEDRIHRIGQHRPSFIRTLVAEGTLDSRIQDILSRKAKIIEKATGGVDDVSVETSNPELSPAKIIEGIITEAAIRWTPDRDRTPLAELAAALA